jgi:hypothetical protein
MTYFSAAVAASGVFIVAGWRSKRVASAACASGGVATADPLWDEAEIDLASSHSQTDIGAAVRLALKRLGPAMAQRSVHAEVAVPSGLMVRMRSATLADLLEDLVTATIHAAPACRLLLTAAAHGDRIHVGVTDDMPGADPAVRVGSVRSLMERVALRGGALDVEVRPAEGTTMTLRLTAGDEDGSDAAKQAAEKSAKGLVPLMPVHTASGQLR